MLRVCDGFDSYTSYSHMLTYWDQYGANFDFGATSGRYGGGATFSHASFNQLTVRKAFGSGRQKVAFGFAIKVNAAPSSTSAFMQLSKGFQNEGNPSGTLAAVSLVMSTGGVLGYVGFNQSSVTYSSKTLSDNAWHWVEGYFDLAGSGATSTVKVYVDGALEIDAENVDICGTPEGDGTFGDNSDNSFGHLAFWAHHLHTIDDVIVYDDDAGGLRATVDFPLGDCRIDTLRPTGAGTTTGWTPSTGANYAAVDEVAANGDTDYVSTLIADTVDTYATADLSVTPASIKAVAIKATFKTSIGNSGGIKGHVKSSSATADGPTIAGTTSYKTEVWEFTTDPNTSAAWTGAGVDAMEIGIKAA